MRFRIGMTDVVAAAVVVLVVVLELVGRNRPVEMLYQVHPPGGATQPDAALASDIGRLEAQLAARPEDGEAAELLAQRLAKARQTDWALRAAGTLAEGPVYPERWRAMLAVSSVHAERVDIPSAYEFARKAFEECDRERNRATSAGQLAETSACPHYEWVRLEVYVNELAAGLEAIRQGIDPTVDPFGFRHAIDAANPRARLRGPAPQQ